MRILSTKQQYEAINQINIIKQAILSGDEIMILNSIENVAQLTYIIGGVERAKKKLPTNL